MQPQQARAKPTPNQASPQLGKLMTGKGLTAQAEQVHVLPSASCPKPANVTSTSTWEPTCSCTCMLPTWKPRKRRGAHLQPAEGVLLHLPPWCLTCAAELTAPQAAAENPLASSCQRGPQGLPPRCCPAAAALERPCQPLPGEMEGKWVLETGEQHLPQPCLAAACLPLPCSAASCSPAGPHVAGHQYLSGFCLVPACLPLGHPGGLHHPAGDPVAAHHHLPGASLKSVWPHLHHPSRLWPPTGHCLGQSLGQPGWLVALCGWARLAANAPAGSAWLLRRHWSAAHPGPACRQWGCVKVAASGCVCILAQKG